MMQSLFGLLFEFDDENITDEDIADVNEDILTVMDGIADDDWKWIMWQSEDSLCVFMSTSIERRSKLAEIEGVVVRTAFEMLPIMKRRTNQWIIPSPRSRRQSVDQAVKWFEDAFDQQFPETEEKPPIAVKQRTSIDSDPPKPATFRPDSKTLLASIQAKLAESEGGA